MTLKDLNERLMSLRDDSGTDYEFIVAICLLFHGITLEDICELKNSDVYGPHMEVRTQIRKLEFSIPADLKGWLDEYQCFFFSYKVWYWSDMLLPVYNDPIILAEKLEDRGLIPEEVFDLGRQCYATYLDRFSLRIGIEELAS